MKNLHTNMGNTDSSRVRELELSYTRSDEKQNYIIEKLKEYSIILNQQSAQLGKIETISSQGLQKSNDNEVTITAVMTKLETFLPRKDFEKYLEDVAKKRAPFVGWGMSTLQLITNLIISSITIYVLLKVGLPT